MDDFIENKKRGVYSLLFNDLQKYENKANQREHQSLAFVIMPLLEACPKRLKGYRK